MIIFIKPCILQREHFSYVSFTSHALHTQNISYQCNLWSEQYNGVSFTSSIPHAQKHSLRKMWKAFPPQFDIMRRVVPSKSRSHVIWSREFCRLFCLVSLVFSPSSVCHGIPETVYRFVDSVVIPCSESCGGTFGRSRRATSW